jgi:predicted AlkP superfamily pyrophosphatase or phosphodiesterase
MVVMAALAAMVPGAGCAPSSAPVSSRANSQATAPAAARVVDRVVVISVDGLQPLVYTEPDRHGLKVPTLREMARAGAASPGARSVFPSVTYPAHATIATGVEPGVHGIVTNTMWDPEEKNQEGWRWYAEDIKVPTLWQAAETSAIPAALVNLPVTVGARARWVVPEYWRAGTADDAKLTRALSTPGLLEAVAARHPDLWAKLTPPNVADEATVDVVVHLLETAPLGLVMAHIWQTDDAQHGGGPGSEEARAAIENADRQLGRVVAAARAAGRWERTVIVVVSDHGFARVERQLRPGVLLRQQGLVALDDDAKLVRSWKATVIASGGLAFFYVADEGDEPTRTALAELLGGLAGKAGSGVGRLFSRAEVRARGGDPRAAFAVEAAAGFSFGGGYGGEAYATPHARGHHGYDPERPDMQASLIFYGGAVRPQRLDGARLVDVAPTVAGLLGLRLSGATGRPLPILR